VGGIAIAVWIGGSAVTDHEKIARLRKRADHLALRILQAKADGRDLSYDRAELSSLLWAVGILEQMLLEKE
jgi:hypothetical protein